MGLNWAEHSIEIAAPIDVCFDAIVDYESFPGWQAAVEKIEVRERDRQGLGTLVGLNIIAKGRRVSYTLRYGYDRPHKIWWDFIEGNGVRDVDGEYRFEELASDRTRATYKLGVDPGLPIPGALARRIHKSALTRSVEDLKREAERRAGAGTGPGSGAGAGSGLSSPGPVARPEPELSGERGYGPLGVLEGPVGAAREAAEQALGIAGSLAASLAGRLGEAVGNVRRGDPGDDEDR